MKNIIPKNPILFGIFISKLHKKWAIAALVFVFIGAGLSRVNVIILRNLTDSLSITPSNVSSVWIWAILYPLLFLLSEGVWRSGGFTGMRCFMNFRLSAYRSLYEYLTLHSKDYFNSRFAGSLANKIANAVDGTEALFEGILWNFMPLILGLIWFSIIAFISDPRLGIILTVWTTIFLVINVWFAKKLQPKSMKAAEALSALKGRVVDSISNISIVHEYANLKNERNYIDKFAKRSTDTGLEHWKLSEWMLTANGVMIFIFMTLMIGTSVYLFQMQSISAGVVVMIIAIVGSLSDQLLFLGQEIRQTAKYYGEAKEGLEEILSEHIIVDSPEAVNLKLLDGDIDIESLDFEYGETKVFNNFSLQIPAGQKVGFVGRSGAGKTTFVSLLLRHYDIQSGAIKIDGQNINGVTLESLRRVIAFVPQDTSLFHRTIKENISYSNPGATDVEIKHAAKSAQAEEFIEKLPNGYETLVGERGVKLSGGQRQRIAIARAFLKDAPILILDEATSSLDSQSEQAIQDSLKKLMKDRTVIAIAHRLSTLKEMDRIIVIADGKVIEDGPPDELLKKQNGHFKVMWDHQVKGFIVDD